MIRILNDSNVSRVSELVQKLETNTRNIIEYRKKIEEAGYIIISVPGKYGGYKIIKEDMFPCLKLTQKRTALSSGAGYLKALNDFPQKVEHESAMEKVFCPENSKVEPQLLFLVFHLQ